MGTSAPVPAAPATPQPPEGGPRTAALLAVVNGVLVGVGSVYLMTRSDLITLLAAASAVILGGLTAIVRL